MIKCLIVDDEPLAIDIIKGYIDQVPQLQWIESCSDAISAYQVMQEKEVDVIFLDIEMPDLNGIDFLKSLSVKPIVILTTAYREYALEGYDLDALDYLLKPISFNRFFKAVTRILKEYNLKETQVSSPIPPEKKPSFQGSIYIYADKKNHKLAFNDILYLESIKDYIRVHTTSKNIITKNTISHYEEILPSNFLRIHRSYIINTDMITAYTQHDVEIQKKEIPIGISYKKKVNDFFK